MKSVSPLIAAIAVLSVAIVCGDEGGVERGRNDEELQFVSFPLIPHRKQHPKYVNASLDGPDRRYLRSLGEEVFVTEMDALYQGYGTHYVQLWIGTPPQRQTLIVDTGSAVTAFPCGGCSGCGSGYHADGYFLQKRSSTFEVVACNSCLLGRCSHSSHHCKLSVAYQEGSSWSAFEGRDVVYAGERHDKGGSDGKGMFHMNFGCQTRLTGLFRTQLADGILGMEMAGESFWHQMYEEGALATQKFSLCFSRQPVASREGTNAGAMTLGGVDKGLHLTPMVYARQLNTRGWYAVEVKKIYLRTRGGERVVSSSDYPHVKRVDISESDLNSGKIIVDSGTTDTYLTSKLLKPFSRAWKDLTGRTYDNNSHRYKDSELLALPTILFQLSGFEAANHDSSAPALAGGLDKDNPRDVLVAMPPTHYMEYSGRNRKYTSRLYFNEQHGGVLGANFMMGHDILFDIDNGRLGFAESNCDYAAAAEREETAGRT